MQSEAYISGAIIRAVPETCRAFYIRRHSSFPPVGMKYGDGYGIRDASGFEYWMPKDIFELSFRRVNSNEFSLLINEI